MATAAELFRTANYNEPHIVINGDRSIDVPNELEYIGVQYDHNIETVVFDCPRYWDGYDLSELDIYINYVDSKGMLGVHECDDVAVSSSNNNIINFSWTILQNLTATPGKIMFLVCAQKSNEDGTVEQCWHSRLCSDCEILPGLECGHGSDEGDIVVPDNYDTRNVLFAYQTDEAITYSVAAYMKTTNGPVIYPITKTDIVYDQMGETLTNILARISTNISVIQKTAEKGVSDASAAMVAATDAQATADIALETANKKVTVLDLTNHTDNKENPHGVTKEQIGLSNLTNNKQMPVSGGTFTGNVAAYETARTVRSLFNEETRKAATNHDGTLQSVKYFINEI